MEVSVDATAFLGENYVSVLVLRLYEDGLSTQLYDFLICRPFSEQFSWFLLVLSASMD